MFEENLDAGIALLTKTLELQTDIATNSRTMAHTFYNYHHQKTNSNDTHETIESQNYTQVSQ